ncbi:hypothetical protein [Breoghania sp. JC706]|uniref:hypothetical protein n=1 Tax=Breoghania sp. JC706 TaxID=3117732 RepID=UPI00300853C0
MLLFLLVLANGAGGPAPEPPAAISPDRIEASFATHVGPPLSPQDMVAALYARTWGGRTEAAMIDVFPDRYVLVRHHGEAFDPGREFPRDAAAMRALVSRVARERDAGEGAPVLFNFSNEQLNAVLGAGLPKAGAIRVVPVPRALYRSDPGGRKVWSAGFAKLIAANADPSAFRRELKRLLSAGGGIPDASVNQDDELRRRVSLAARAGGALSRIGQGIENYAVIFLYGMFALIILRTERKR